MKHDTDMKNKWFILLLPMVLLCACNKLVSISEPTDRISNTAVFSSDALANSAMNGVYNSLLADAAFSKSIASLYGSLSADEMLTFNSVNSTYYPINTNHITVMGIGNARTTPTDNIWTSAYSTIYNTNAVIEGIAASTSHELHDSARQQLTAEAKCLRAFCYFYLVNFYGDVPLILTINYNAVATIARSPQDAVYQQIITDLQQARNNLADNYSAGKGKRVRVNKWAATALLARVYLFKKDYASATAMATELINQQSLFALEPSLGNVFLNSSREAIWQLNPKTKVTDNDNTPDGVTFLPGLYIRTPGDTTGIFQYVLSSQLLNAFEQGDKRRSEWVDSLPIYSSPLTGYYMKKYKIGNFNYTQGADPVEYPTVLRLAELYLVRAEAQANGTGGNIAGAIADLNTVRARAGLPALIGNLSPADLQAAIAHEWQVEFFCEWAHRWFYLKRTGQATKVLSQIALKQPWAGDYQLLYPLPPSDLNKDLHLVQNPGY
ncbi:RagB/SusD family nutrient uptake outer membrane protein [Chitinophaga eiseniae]|uniref:RagB/SusD family nutrient uptake outer membrane protein n=1 Tax=Chitinophaga eiseniae TaxID=634771 RepID=A0A847SEQ1_9BACT|nr:RagB/SusD family nutrient uptake outer membrane protein [Chitinophaga eiseniae]NLR77317.1 RagB/SusD family nutrient uptake outer membrane protein [Chitinophaga eiseniae]